MPFIGTDIYLGTHQRNRQLLIFIYKTNIIFTPCGYPEDIHFSRYFFQNHLKMLVTITNLANAIFCNVRSHFVVRNYRKIHFSSPHLFVCLFVIVVARPLSPGWRLVMSPPPPPGGEGGDHSPLTTTSAASWGVGKANFLFSPL